ncbi:MAG: sugar phosphate isomerase/epimerase [Clostridia bacterium]|nr:sugar phosphate isomerase/epimerase [Clostridia bacterium]
MMCNPDCYWFDNAKDVLELVELVNHPRFKVCWDVGHGNLQKLPQHEALEMLGENVYALHIQDNVGVTDDHMLPFFGLLNFDSIMHGLKNIGYKGYFTFEADGTLLATWRRNKFDEDTRCFDSFPVEIRKKLESVLYDIGKYILTKYDCFEE